MQSRLIVLLIVLCAPVAFGVNARAAVESRVLKLVPRRIALAGGRSFNLNLPEGFTVSVAAQGLRRVRFMAKSPDGRIFVTDMHSLADNKRGVVYILDEFDEAGKIYRKVTPYLKSLRNPNSIAFYTERDGTHWFYLALTDRLLRYRYREGEDAPGGEPEVLATFPDYGLSYKYGGWHLTRTIAIARDKIYISVGSSCNACIEKEEVRASIIEMDADGKNRRFFARGLRNAVGLRWVGERLFATNMGADHLGDKKPADTMHVVRDGANYGWPFCFQSGARRFADIEFNARGRKMSCRKADPAYVAFDAHSSPLGLDYFDAKGGEELRDSFLVALHGSTKEGLKRGYRVVRLRKSGAGPPSTEDFVNGFMQAGKIFGRPVDILNLGADTFLLTDDHAGVVYYIYKKQGSLPDSSLSEDLDERSWL
jgi:glucose/arabinose dehydrogenase